MQTLQARRTEQQLIATGRKLLSQQQYGGSIRLSDIDFDTVLSRADNDNFILVSTCITGLACGTTYRLYITSRSSIGQSAPSPLSYSVVTLPGVPVTPVAPVLAEVGLTYLRFTWDAPYDGGTAVQAYK